MLHNTTFYLEMRFQLIGINKIIFLNISYKRSFTFIKDSFTTYIVSSSSFVKSNFSLSPLLSKYCLRKGCAVASI